MLPALLVSGGDKHFQRRVTGTGTHSRKAGVNTVTALFYRHQRVGNAKAQVMVRVHTGLRFRFKHLFQRAEAIANIVHVHCAAGVHHINTGCAVAFHQFCPLRQIFRRGHMAHHQKTDGVHPEFAGVGNMLRGNVCFGAMRRHTHHAGPCLIGIFQVVQRADTRDQ